MKLKNLFLLTIVIGFFSAKGQCIPDNLCADCIGNLTKAKFNFIKSFKIDGDKGGLQKVEYSYVLTKGSKYMINMCAIGGGPDKVLFTLMDYQRAKVASNVYNGKNSAVVFFECNSTGIYYFQYSFAEAAIDCGCSVIGFTR